MTLTKYEGKLQKKGIANMSKDELLEWITVCGKYEKDVKFNKARRSWKQEREKAEKRLLAEGE